ncbi:MAG: hypothetical protein JWQ38_1189 [Flavipsychrobacter sp.]|nr:hypothetical protein [Flavipsychrobacter sp.]
MITWENYEEYMMMHTDGELSPDEERALMAFIEQHHELKKELAAFDLTRSVADNTQVYANKEALLKPLPAKRIIALPTWGRYSIAAGIAAIIFISLFRYQSANKISEVAVIDTTSHKQTARTATPALATTIAPVKNDTPVSVAPPVARAVAHTDMKLAVKERRNKQQQVLQVITPEQPVVKEVITIRELPVAATQKMPSANEPVMQEIKELPAYTTVEVADDEAKKRSFLDRLPIDDLKKQQLENIAGSFAGAYHDVNKAKQDLYSKSITIKVEKRKLIIGF